MPAAPFANLTRTIKTNKIKDKYNKGVCKKGFCGAILYPWASGGIGIHDGLKIRSPQGDAGSIPASPTNLYSFLSRPGVFCFCPIPSLFRCWRPKPY